ncbi:pilin N-terminal domain-containing protein [Lactiplantibacillus plantarum]|uniref:pilin N-terminal domain-containing protein n=1 Tax=Lactiplantibacillus plantarum TaxID=1590 RepID=UPI003098B2FD
MSKRLFAANLMMSAVLLTAVAPTLGASASSSNTVTMSTASSVKGTSQSEGTSQTATSKVSDDKIQTLQSQTMILKKIVVKDDSVKNQAGVIGIPVDKFKGINNSTFKVYDVTDLMNQIIKEKLKVNTNKDVTTGSTDQGADHVTAQSVTSSSENVNDNRNTNDQVAEEAQNMMKGNSLRLSIADRAAKLNADQLKLVTTVKTAHDAKSKADGIARVTLPIDGKYHAYYVVNTDTPKDSHVANADPLVVITPITEDDGLYADSFTLYPKSDNIPQKRSQDLKKVTTTRLYQTGNKSSQSLLGKLIAVVWNMF